MALSRSSNTPDYGSMNTNSTARGSPNIQQNPNFDVAVYNQLCDDISCNIFAINNTVTGLEKASKDIGSSSDTEDLREKIHRTRQSTKELVSQTTQTLKKLSDYVLKGGRAHRLQVDRVRNEFRATVQRYDEMQKVLDPKLKLHAVQRPTVPSSVWDPEEDEEQQALMEAERQQQIQVQEELEFEHGLLVEREEAIRKLESDILNVNDVFRELATQVHEQGTTLGTIEENITSVAYNVEGAHEQLVKARNYQSAYRKKLCCFVFILVIVSVIIAIIVAVSLNTKQ